METRPERRGWVVVGVVVDVVVDGDGDGDDGV
jgi:hypothetical protein